MLGMFAMLVALVAVPLASASVVAAPGAPDGMAAMDTAHAMADAAAEEMPCHRSAPPQHCPDCPQQACPNLGACLVKCFQTLSSPLTAIVLHRDVASSRIAPALSPARPGSLTPPLLRPPSV